MDPEKAHEKYFKENPNGNHPYPSPETLRFMERQDKTNKELLEIVHGIREHVVKIVAKVDSIDERTKKANGRTSKNEIAIGSLSAMVLKYRNMAAGATFLIGVVWSVVTFAVPVYQDAVSSSSSVVTEK